MRFLILIALLLLICNHLYAQDLYTKELNWSHHEFSNTVSFIEIDEVLEWCIHQIPFVSDTIQKTEKWRMDWVEGEQTMVILKTKDLNIKNDEYFVVISEGCFGIPNIGVHPLLLHYSIIAYNNGFRPDLYSYYLYSR